MVSSTQIQLEADVSLQLRAHVITPQFDIVVTCSRRCDIHINEVLPTFLYLMHSA